MYVLRIWIGFSSLLSAPLFTVSVLAQLLIHFYILGNIFKSAIVCKKVNSIQVLKAI